MGPAYAHSSGPTPSSLLRFLFAAASCLSFSCETGHCIVHRHMMSDIHDGYAVWSRTATAHMPAPPAPAPHVCADGCVAGAVRVQQTAHGAVQFTVYEEFKHMAARWGATSPSQPDRPITSLETSVRDRCTNVTGACLNPEPWVLPC